jgi:hypothetical protein
MQAASLQLASAHYLSYSVATYSLYAYALCGGALQYLDLWEHRLGERGADEADYL